MSVMLAKRKADQLIRSCGISSAPVDVERLALGLGIQVVKADLGTDVSGLLVTNQSITMICVQQTDHKKRQRFTIAHEIGHHVLNHQFEAGDHVHVDRGNYISKRGPRASAGIDIKEIEANQFAACLLMPADLIQNDIAVLGRVTLLDSHVTELADKYQVSEQAMTIRLDSLGYL